MSQFDETTEKKAEDYRNSYVLRHDLHRIGFTVGRNSAKESLEILARAVLHYERMFEDWAMSSGAQTLEQARDPESKATKAIAAVKARGDWPLPDAGKGGG